MFKGLYFRIKYRSFLANASGKTQFGNLLMGSLVQEGTEIKRDFMKKIGVLDERIGRMTHTVEGKVERKLKDFGDHQDGRAGAAPLSAEERATIARRRWLNLILVGIMLTVEVFLNYLSMMLLISGRGAFMVAARIALAIGATAIPFLAIHKAFDSAHERTETQGGWFRVVFATVLSALLLVALYALASARARDFEGGTAGIIYYGFIILTVVFPIVAGWFWFDRELIMAKYARRTKWLDARRQGEQLGEETRALDLRTSVLKAEAVEVLRKMIYGYWSTMVYFVAVKDRLDAKRGNPVDEVEGFARVEETFVAESWKKLGLGRDSFDTVKVEQ